MTTEIGNRTREHRENGGAAGDSLIEQIGERMGATVKASTIFGEPVERDGLTVIPIAKARWGFGGGGGTGQDQRQPGGGGGGMVMSPVGFIELRGDHAEFRPIRDPRTYLPFVIAATVLVALFLRSRDR